MTAHTPTDNDRLIRNLINTGTISEVNVPFGLARVAIGELLTNWLPWMCPRAGKVRIWSAPSAGEQCLVLAPGGHLGAGIILTGIYSSRIAPPEGSVDDVIVDVPVSGKLVLRCGSSSVVITENSIKALAGRIDLN